MESQHRKQYLLKLGMICKPNKNIEEKHIGNLIKNYLIQYQAYKDKYLLSENENNLNETFIDEFVNDYHKQNNEFRYKYIKALTENNILFASKPKTFQSSKFEQLLYLIGMTLYSQPLLLLKKKKI